MKWLKISFRNIIRNYRRSITAILTVAIATTAIVVGYGFLNFTFWGLTRSIVQGGVGNIQIADKRTLNQFEDYQMEFGLKQNEVKKTISKIKSNRGVRQVLRRIEFKGIISNENNKNPDVKTEAIFSGFGVEPKKESRLRGGNAVGRYIKGKRISGKNKYQVELAKDLARKIKVGVGDKVTILSNGVDSFEAVVVGIFSTGIPQRDELELKVPLSLAQDLLDTKKISYMVVQLKNLEETEKFIPFVKKNLNRKMSVQPWWDIDPYLLGVKSVYYNIFGVMGIIILVVVLLSVSNVMNTSVMERTYEVGTLRAFGISKNRMRINFITEGIIIGIIGTFIGVTISLILTFVVSKVGYMMPPPPARTEPYPLLIMPTLDSILITVATMITISALASFMPINNVVRKKIIDNIKTFKR